MLHSMAAATTRKGVEMLAASPLLERERRPPGHGWAVSDEASAQLDWAQKG